MPYIDGREVKRRASGKWDDILRRLAPSLAPFLDKPGKHGPCPVHGTEGSGDGFRVYKDVKDTGGGHCNTCGGFPDGFSLIAFATGDSYKVILSEVDKILGGADIQSDKRAPAAPAKPKFDPAVQDQSIRQRLSSVYASSLTLTHPDAEPARLYLKQRGFTLLPTMLRMHPGLNWQDFEGKTVVTFCTGGVRCEKAAIYMRHVGFDTVYQLDGGILKYFEDVGGVHYSGECFVFDERTAVSNTLDPST